MLSQSYVKNHGAILSLVAPFLLNLGGCAKAEEVGDACVYLNDPGDCTASGDGTSGGDDDDGEVRDACILGTPDGHTRTVHQCIGQVFAEMSFTTLNGNCAETLKDASLCQESHYFGPAHDPYDMPAVMACCDVDAAIDEDERLQYCAADLIEQVCRSIPMRLQKLIDDDKIGAGKEQAQKLQNWLAKHPDVCYQKLYRATDEPGRLAPATWLVNNGKNGHWPLLNDFTITITSAAAVATWLPEDEDLWQSCTDIRYNNTEIFEQADPDPDPSPDGRWARLRESPIVSIEGPPMFGGPVSGTGTVESLASGCRGPRCSTLEFTVDHDAAWTLEELEFFARGAVRLTNGPATLAVERAAIRLYGNALGTRELDARRTWVHTIASGHAHFVISGVGGGDVYGLRWATNATPIELVATEHGWSLDQFVLEHDDGRGSWFVSLPATRWDPTPTPSAPLTP
jgi:hypothetical protein